MSVQFSGLISPADSHRPCQAPVSLAGALQEYLDDPNFEQNRIEYKLQKDNAEKNGKSGVTPSKAGSSVKFDDKGE